MGRQLFNEGPYLDPPVSSPTALVATTIETLILGSTWAPIFANDPKASKIYILHAGGIISTGASGTLIITPTYGAAVGTALGVSATQTVPVSLTNVPWTLDFELVFRTIGIAGANSTCVGTGKFCMQGTAATAGSGTVIPFGGTVASVDATINGGICIQKTLSVAGSIQLQYAYLWARN
jgi:hypothetical protein